PNSSRVFFALARARDELGDTQGSIRAYEEVLRIKPDHPQAIFNIAGCYQSMGNLQEAIKWFRRYANLTPQAPDAIQVQGIINALSEKSSAFAFDPKKVDYCDAVAENGRFHRWPRERLPIKVFVSDGQYVPGFNEQFRYIFFESLNTWMKASQGRLHYVLVDNKEQADMTCEWTGNPFDVKPTGNNVEQGVCKLKSVDRGRDFIEIERADIRILTIDRSTQKPLSEEEMKKTCLHELGHAMGLQGHSTNNHDIMFFAMSTTVWPVISKRDKATLFRVYEGYPQLGSY
ncbi:MAG TPA: tetratricopeptide repeat protein, partial [Candidatus Obscuribacterales bacterium]